ncbi:Putative galactinol--sucrose galactosyltransferase 2 [Glycine soja]|uniref:galactinol--sucrose galactosyltransferase n=1 Tax=Glycine soja TaxID=3848 RepID=A0A0B2PF82_GLYSO|nr:Putative galactinol--sucrose galactosyltransferase 2 [Glycine soja]
MTITAAPTVKDRCLEVRGKVILTHVTGNIVVSPVVGTESAFLGATSTVSSSRHVFDLGILQGYKLLSLFRVKIWWMIPPVGRSASDVPMETQLLLLKKEKSLRLRMSFLLTLKSQLQRTLATFSFCLFWMDSFAQLCRELNQMSSSSALKVGDAYVQASQSLEAAFVNSGDNPFELIGDSIKILEKHKGTFCHLENKRIPAHLDWFGWSTWDAFYTEVSPQGIKEGLQSFLNEGCSPKFIIIDDGWQETLNTFRKEGESVIEGTQFATRLIDIKENKKFTNAGSENSCNNLHDFVDSIKQNMNVKYVYMWHTLTGYWGGVLPSSDALKKYNPKILYPIQSPGTTGNLRDVAMDSLEKYGVGIIDPEKLYDFYNDSHSYLASCGVDGVKVDVSKHETAESHAAARSIGGCAVYVSDKPGNHDFKILKKLVLPDGSVLRARYAGHPTRDCLFEDPVMDGKSLLKICNLNVLTGVVGVFNCQGAGSWSLKSLEAAPSCITISGKVRPLDVEFLEEAAGENWNGDCIVYAFKAGLLSKVSCRGKLEVSLETLQCEIYTVSPIRVFGHDVQFAPIGLLDMYNSGGAIEALDCTMDVAQCVVKIKGRGCGRFGAYSNVRPKSCVVDMKEEEFSYIPEDGLLTITLGCEGNSRDMEFVY